MLAGRALAIVLVANDNPWDAGGLVLAANVGNTTALTSDIVLKRKKLV